MSKTFEFVVPGEVIGQGRPRAFNLKGHIRMYDPDKSRDYKSKINMYAFSRMKALGMDKLQEADGKGFRVKITAYFAPPKSYSKKKYSQAMAGEIRPTKKPDCDNIIKAVLDALNNVFWEDDRLVSSVYLTKEFLYQPQLRVSVDWDEPEKKEA